MYKGINESKKGAKPHFASKFVTTKPNQKTLFFYKQAQHSYLPGLSKYVMQPKP